MFRLQRTSLKEGCKNICTEKIESALLIKIYLVCTLSE